MREGVQDSRLQELLKVQGSTEFILVYPPVQRVTALVNASVKYLLCINCDEHLHTNIPEITEDYFTNFPESYFFRLNQVQFPLNKLPIDKPWNLFPNIQNFEVRKRDVSKAYSDEENKYTMREIPIVPFDNKLDFLAVLRGIEMKKDLIKKTLTRKFGKIILFKKHSRRLNRTLLYLVHLNIFLFGGLTD